MSIEGFKKKFPAQRLLSKKLPTFPSKNNGRNKEKEKGEKRLSGSKANLLWTTSREFSDYLHTKSTLVISDHSCQNISKYSEYAGNFLNFSQIVVVFII